MNIQIFGKAKCFATKAAERFFKERGIKVQYIDILDKGLSPKELENILSKIKDLELLINKKNSFYESLNFGMLRTNEMKKKILLENPQLFVTPIVRDCDSRECTIGQNESIWKTWDK